MIAGVHSIVWILAITAAVTRRATEKRRSGEQAVAHLARARLEEVGRGARRDAPQGLVAPEGAAGAAGGGGGGLGLGRRRRVVEVLVAQAGADAHQAQQAERAREPVPGGDVSSAPATRMLSRCPNESLTEAILRPRSRAPAPARGG
jgi:hypothetical protein